MTLKLLCYCIFGIKTFRFCNLVCNSGGSRISRKGAHMYKGVGVSFSNLISLLFNIEICLNVGGLESIY